jgi:hypothetical protein
MLMKGRLIVVVGCWAGLLWVRALVVAQAHVQTGCLQTLSYTQQRSCYFCLAKPISIHSLNGRESVFYFSFFKKNLNIFIIFLIIIILFIFSFFFQFCDVVQFVIIQKMI